jgi:hypothetical protein
MQTSARHLCVKMNSKTLDYVPTWLHTFDARHIRYSSKPQYLDKLHHSECAGNLKLVKYFYRETAFLKQIAPSYQK